jgi:hypothetical protein
MILDFFCYLLSMFSNYRWIRVSYRVVHTNQVFDLRAACMEGAAESVTSSVPAIFVLVNQVANKLVLFFWDEFIFDPSWDPSWGFQCLTSIHCSNSLNASETRFRFGKGGFESGWEVFGKSWDLSKWINDQGWDAVIDFLVGIIRVFSKRNSSMWLQTSFWVFIGGFCLIVRGFWLPISNSNCWFIFVEFLILWQFIRV